MRPLIRWFSVLAILALVVTGCVAPAQQAPAAPPAAPAATDAAAEPAAPETEAEPATEEENVLVIYTARDTSILDFAIPRFEELNPEYSGQVQVLNMGAQQIFERVRAESENPQADIWWGGTQQQFSLATDEGLLMEITPPPAFVERIPEEYRPETNTWFPEILLPEVIMYNSDMLTAEEAPQDWDDLIDPKWEDQIIIRAVLPSGTMRTIYSAMIARYWEEDQSPERGYEFLRQLDANTREYAADPTNLYLRLARQEGSVSLWNLQDILIQRERQNMPFDYVIAESGVPILTDGVAVIQNARHPQAAQRFLEFLYDDTIRAELAEQFYQIPVTPLPAESQPAWLQELELVPMDLPWDVMAEREQEWMQYWDQNIRGRGGQ